VVVGKDDIHRFSTVYQYFIIQNPTSVFPMANLNFDTAKVCKIGNGFSFCKKMRFCVSSIIKTAS
jgi:hypothetical protein